MKQKSKSKAIQSGWLLLGIMLIASTLRAPLTGIGPVLDLISNDLGLSATQAGMLTTLPLLVFAFFSPVSSSLARRFGLEPSLMAALIIIMIGLIIRSEGTTVFLFIGTGIIGGGIAICNVLLPSILKRDYPKQVPTLTAIYVLIMGVSSAIISSTAIPMLDVANNLRITAIPPWALSLIGVCFLPAISILLWVKQVKNHTKPAEDTTEIDSHSYLWRSTEAWHITIFLGINSFIMYIFIGWLPSILIDSGYSESQAGNLHGILQLATALPALIFIPLMAKIKDKRGMGLAMALLTFIGIVGLIVIPEYAIIWILCFGFSCGGGFILGLSLIGLRTHDAHQAAVLSGMAQSMGYLLAATGPIIFGSLHEMTGSWHISLMVCALVSLVWAIVAMFAGRPNVITDFNVQEYQCKDNICYD